MTADTKRLRSEQECRWLEEMERLGPENVRLRFAHRMAVTDVSPYPEAAFVQAWLQKKQAQAERLQTGRFQSVRRWTIAAAIAGIIAAIGAIIAAWPVLFPWAR
jgi:hypothetical protein